MVINQTFGKGLGITLGKEFRLIIVNFVGDIRWFEMKLFLPSSSSVKRSSFYSCLDIWYIHHTS